MKSIHAPARNIHYTAINVPHVLRAEQLVPGHFLTTEGYLVVRDKGTTDWLFIYTVAGEGRLGGGRTVGPGDAVLWPPGSRHEYGIADGCACWEFHWAHFMPWPHWEDLLAWPEDPDGARQLRVDEPGAQEFLAALCVEMNDHALGSSHRAQILAMNALERILLALDPHNPASGRRRIDPRIQRALAVLDRRFAEPLSLHDLATESCLSQSRFSHLFAAQVGVTPMAYLESRRIDRARQLLLQSALSVSQIAAMVGYDTPFYFTRRFTSRMGCSPRAFRASSL